MSFQGNKDVRVQGSSVSLAPTGVTPGTYNLVTVDLNGRVTAGGGSGGTPVSGTITVALSTDASGSGSGSGASPTITVPVTLDTVNSNVGTFQGITVNGKGLVTAAANQGYLTGNQTITLSGDVSGSGTTAITVTLDTVNSNVGTFQGITVNGKGLVTAAISTTGQIPGSNTNDTANAGNIGEFVSASVTAASAGSISTGIPADITSISLTGGDWDVDGLLGLVPASSVAISQIGGWVNSVSATAPGVTQGAHLTFPLAFTSSLSGTVTYTPTSNILFPLGRTRFSLSGTTTIYLSTNCSFTVGTLKAYGHIEARRVR